MIYALGNRKASYPDIILTYSTHILKKHNIPQIVQLQSQVKKIDLQKDCILLGSFRMHAICQRVKGFKCGQDSQLQYPVSGYLQIFGLN